MCMAQATLRCYLCLLAIRPSRDAAVPIIPSPPLPPPPTSCSHSHPFSPPPGREVGHWRQPRPMRSLAQNRAFQSEAALKASRGGGGGGGRGGKAKVPKRG